MTAAQQALVNAIQERAESLSGEARNSSLYTDACKNIERLSNALTAVERVESGRESGIDPAKFVTDALKELRKRGLLG